MAFRRALSFLLLVVGVFIGIAESAKSSGCGRPLASGLTKGGPSDSNNLTFTTSSGVLRTLILHVPSEYDVNSPSPLIFSFHGRSESGLMQEAKTGFSIESNNPNSVVIYPDGINQEWQGDPDAKTDDVGFTNDMITNLTSTFCVDSERIYSSGFSNGAGFSLNILACDPTASLRIAAFMGGSSADYQGPDTGNCDGNTVAIKQCPGVRTNLPILETHGSADNVIAYYGGSRRSYCLPTIPRFVQNWAGHDKLSAVNVTTSLASGNVQKYEFGGGLVTSYYINGLGHDWPTTAFGLDGTATVLQWFSRWTLSGAASSSSSSASLKPTTMASTSTTTSPSTKSSTSSKALTTTTSTVVSSTSSASKTSTQSSAPLPVSASTSLTCPSANGTTYTDGTGARYQVLCGYDTSTSPFGNIEYVGFADCMEYCSSTAGCEVVAYTGACYLKKAAGSIIIRPSMQYRTGVRVGQV